jgi:hypothetical protein
MSGWGLLLVVAGLALVDVMVCLGWTADSRDETYSLGRVIRGWRRASDDEACS